MKIIHLKLLMKTMKFALNNKEIEMESGTINEIVFDDEYYWELINKINLYESIKHIKEQEFYKKILELNLTIDELNSLKNFIVQKRLILDKVITSFIRIQTKEVKNKFNINEEKKHDLFSTIVGMGKTITYLIIDNPSIIFEVKNKKTINLEFAIDEAIEHINKLS